MLAPRKIKFEAQKRERENLEFRTFKSVVLMKRNWMSSLPGGF